MPADIAIESVGLTKTYHTKPVLDRFSIEIRVGESVALLGANGAGKTTLIRLLLGLEGADPPPDGGECNVLGCRDGKLTSVAKERIGYIADDAGPVAWASAKEVARLYATIYARWDQAMFNRLIEQWSVPPDRKLVHLSKGQRRLAEFALALAYRPDLLVLDEPFNGLDAVNRICLHSILGCLLDESKVTIVYTTHVLEEVGKLARRLVILRDGRKVDDTPIDRSEGAVEKLFRSHYGDRL
jgi:ABC-2 type transport system ATP-binding protein